jgi:MarR family transcriptional regulator, temperature-dependent positive regulator of motility
MNKTTVKTTGLDRSILHLLHRAGQQAEVVFMAELNGDDLTPRQYAVLLTVDQNEDISQTGLVAATGIDRSTLADVVRRLVSKGYLQRRRTRQDARMYAVRLTAKGRDALSATRPAAARADERVLASLSVRQRQDFLAILSDVVRSMDEMSAAA